jgi:hypothetical protein
MIEIDPSIKKSHMNIKLILLWLIPSVGITTEQCRAQANPRHLEEIAFDFHRNKLMVFGGSEIQSKGFTNPSGLFELGDAGWQQDNSNGPVGRRGHALVYHDRDRLTYLLAGVTGTQKDSLLFDVWSWNGVAWKKLETQTPVKNPEGVYDSEGNSILIYGDASDKSRETYGDEQIFQLWQFKEGQWKMLSDSGPRPDGPFEMSFDSKRAALIIPTWKDGKLIVWEWAASKWNRIDCASDCPAPRNRFAMAFSSSEGLSYLFGGRDALNKERFFGDFWSWNGSQWKSVESDTLPPARAGLTMEDSSRGVILYGGITLKDGKTRMTSELWQWRGGSWSR